MKPLNLPSYPIKIKQVNGQTAIYDYLRQRYIHLTPEEWVRQHFTHFLVEHKHYPAGRLANEISIVVGGSTRRCDTVFYHKEGGRPQVIIEYKAPNIPITQAVFQQIYAYNSVLRADYLIVSNGISHYCCQIDYKMMSVNFLHNIPDYNEL